MFKAEVALRDAVRRPDPGRLGRPDRRGEGLAAAGMAAVVELVRREIAPVVSLYVNEWNMPARRGLRAGRVQRDRDASPRSCSDRGQRSGDGDLGSTAPDHRSRRSPGQVTVDVRHLPGRLAAARRTWSAARSTSR